MNFAFNDEQQELRRSARSFLASHCTPQHVRDTMETEAGYDVDLWRRISSELGWPAVIVPEPYGGLGLGQVELVALMEVMGASLLCAPFFSSIGLAANALVVAGTDQQKEVYLPRIASGESVGTLALTEANGRWDAAGVRAVARRDGGDYVLDGSKRYVPDGHVADLFVIAARTEGTDGEEGISLFVVPADAGGMERRLLPTMDQTRKQAELRLRDVRVPSTALMGQEGRGWPSLRSTLDLAAIALSAEQVGGAERCLDMSVQYAKEREQFGRPIGSFQAIKHKCADMLLLVESARSAAYYAAAAADAGDEDLPALASLAKAYCSDAYFRCAAESVQIHGGVGFTWEYDVHLYFKRAKSSETLLGNAAYHRELVARRIGL